MKQKSKKQWQYKDILYGLYVEQELTIRTVAEILHTTPSNITYWMKKHGIPSRKYDITNLNKGKKLSDKEKQYLSEVAKRRFQDPHNHPMFGHKHTEDAKRKMSETRRKRKAEQGDADAAGMD